MDSSGKQDINYQALFSLAPEATGVCQAGTEIILDANQSFCRMLGLESPEGLIGKPLLDCFLPEKHPFSDNTLRVLPATTDLPCRIIRIHRSALRGSSVFMVTLYDETRKIREKGFQDLFLTLTSHLKPDFCQDNILDSLVQGLSSLFPFPLVERVLVSRPEKTWPQTENLFNQIPFLRESPDQDSSSSFNGIFSALPSGGLSYSLAIDREGSGPGINLRFSATEIPARQYFLDIDALCGQIWQSGNQPSGKRDITFDQAPDGIYLISPDTLLIRETNHVFCQMLGFPDKQFFVGTPVTEWWNESEPEIRSLINRLSRTNTRSLTCRQRYSRMDGSHFLSDSTITFVTDSGQQSLLVHVRDISKEYELETINKISVELDQLILNDAPIEKLLQTVIGHLTNGFTFQIVHVATPTPEGTFSFLGIDRHPDQPGYRSLKDAMMASNRWDRGAGRQTSYGLATETGNSVFLTGEALENDPLFPQYLSLGIASVFSIPVANRASCKTFAMRCE